MLPERLTKLRKEMGLTQAQLVRKLCSRTGYYMTEQTYGRYEKGQRTPNCEALLGLAQFFGVSMEYLWGYMPMRTETQDVINMAETTGLSKEAIDELIHNKASSRTDRNEMIDYIIKDGMLMHYLSLYLMHANEMLRSTRLDFDDVIYAFRIGNQQLYADDIRNAFLIKIEAELINLQFKISETQRKEAEKTMKPKKEAQK